MLAARPLEEVYGVTGGAGGVSPQETGGGGHTGGGDYRYIARPDTRGVDVVRGHWGGSRV